VTGTAERITEAGFTATVAVSDLAPAVVMATSGSWCSLEFRRLWNGGTYMASFEERLQSYTAIVAV